MKQLTKKTQLLVDEFDEAAKYWGWAQDAGYGSSVNNAEQQYDEAKAKLIRRLSRLENPRKVTRKEP